MSVVANHVRAPRASWSIADAIASPRAFWLILALYIVTHIALRLWETPLIAKNDVQEAVSAQVWAWGYHPRNPPLHTWLLMSAYSVFGIRVVAHVVLKYALLAATYGFAYLCGRRVLSTPTLAAFSALSLILVSPFAWTVHTALTHTLLLAACVFATLWAALRLTAQQRPVDYIVFGVTIALGFLAKYSYGLFLVPLLGAMLSQRELRPALLDPRALLALATAAILSAPHAVWMATARFDFAAFLTEKQHAAVTQPYLFDVASGAGSVVVGALSFLAPFILVFPLVFHRAFGAKAAPAQPWGRAITLLPLLGIGLLVLDVVALRATQFEQRYFFWALLTAPLALFVWLDRRGYSEQQLRWFAASIVVGSAIVLGGLIGKSLLSHRSCDRCWEEMPVAELVRQVRTAGFVDGTIIADHYNLAGNMRLAFPDSRIMAANYVVPQPAFAGPGQCLVVWNARNAGDGPPASIVRYLAHANLALPAEAPRFVNAPMLRSRTRMDRFAYWVAPHADGACHPR